MAVNKGILDGSQAEAAELETNFFVVSKSGATKTDPQQFYVSKDLADDSHHIAKQIVKHCSFTDFIGLKPDKIVHRTLSGMGNLRISILLDPHEQKIQIVPPF